MNDQEKGGGNVNIGDIGSNFSGKIDIRTNQPPAQPVEQPTTKHDEPAQMDPIQRELQNRLHKGLNKYFDVGEVKTLCFELGIDYEELVGETSRGKNRELVKYCARHQLLEELQAACRQARPKISW